MYIKEYTNYNNKTVEHFWPFDLFKGPPGIQGIQGIQGIPGDPGPPGIQGIQGIQEIPGDPGPSDGPLTKEGIRIELNDIKNIGTKPDQNINVTPKGTGSLIVNSNLIVNGILSNNLEKPMVWDTEAGIACWKIHTTSFLVDYGNPIPIVLRFNIHNLAIRDSKTNASYFAVVAFTYGNPQAVLFLSQASTNGLTGAAPYHIPFITINASHVYNGSGNSFIIVQNIPQDNQLYYKLT